MLCRPGSANQLYHQSPLGSCRRHCACKNEHVSQSDSENVSYELRCASSLCDALRQTCVELPGLRDVEPTDFLLHDAVEKQFTDTFDLAPSCQGPE